MRCAGVWEGKYGVEVRERHECAENPPRKRLSCVLKVFV